MKKLTSIFIATILGFCTYAFAAKKAVPFNKKCPVSGKAIDADKTIGIGVCCGNCAKKVVMNSKGIIGKLKSDSKDPDTVNISCPISAKGLRKVVTVGFCYSNARASTHPSKFIRSF